jgi:hypothetical protein
MNDKERLNVLISAISNEESRLARLDKERHKILAELKSRPSRSNGRKEGIKGRSFSAY